MPLRAWRKRVGVEPTTRLAKSRINGFEGHEDHRTPFASEMNVAPAARYTLRPLDSGQTGTDSSALVNYRSWTSGVQLVGVTVAYFLRASSRSFGSVQTS